MPGGIIIALKQYRVSQIKLIFVYSGKKDLDGMKEIWYDCCSGSEQR
jgi:hypothetical protein